MNTNQKITVGVLIAVFIVGLVAVVKYYNNKKEEMALQQQSELNYENGGANPINTKDLVLQSWGLLLGVLKKKKANSSNQTVTHQDVIDYVGSVPGSTTA